MSESKPHIGPEEVRRLVQTARLWLDEVYGDTSHSALDEIEQAFTSLFEQLEAARETFRLIAMACGEDGTEPDDWRAMTHPSHAEAALTATRDLRDAYDELLMDPRLADTYPAYVPVEGTGGPVFEGHSYDGRTFYPGKPEHEGEDFIPHVGEDPNQESSRDA